MDDAGVVRLRDRMSRRGPDGAGLWRMDNVVLAHRRLSVIDPSEAGAQPMVLVGAGGVGDWADPAALRVARAGEGVDRAGRVWALAYNGELYNDAELRAELERQGHRFSTRCDTETVLRALACWGSAALARFRGMFALAFFDAKRDEVLLARDPLGIKPLYYSVGAREVVFSSDVGVTAEASDSGARPDAVMMSAYVTTIRTVLGDRTLYEGVNSVRGGECVRVELGGERPVVTRLRASSLPVCSPVDIGGLDEELVSRVRSAVTGSVVAHLRSDVPMCCLLSGGLDSTIVATIAAARHPRLRTYCAGAVVPADCRDKVTTSDLQAARVASSAIGTDHAEAVVSREMFRERWAWMVGEMGVPLSTPNEVAIWAVASRLREDGCVVTLSGEGADELFGGYEGPMRAALRCAEAVENGEAVSPETVELDEAAWVPMNTKGAALSDRLRRLSGEDGWLRERWAAEFRAAEEEAGGYSAEAHLRFHRRVNLTGLLQRLDTATMLAGVEGRTPLADVRVAAAAFALPMSLKFRIEAGALVGGIGPGGSDTGDGGGVAATKIALRDAFAPVLPESIVRRPKESFPLPFQEWVADHGETLRGSGFAREVFSDAAIALVAQRPTELWRLAWPMINLAMWGSRFG